MSNFDAVDRKNVSDSCELNIELYCELLQSTERISLSFPALPGAFDEIKEVIEEKCSIPSYSQVVWIDNNRVEPCPSTTPASCYLQSGDTLNMSFPNKCDCKSVKETIKWLTECFGIVQNIKKSETKETVRTLYEENYTILGDDHHIKILVDDLFTPWAESEKQMNANYFDYLGGITLLVKLHKEMCSLRNSNLFSELHSFSEHQESYYCTALGNFASDTPSRRRVTACGGLERCLATFMAHPVNDLKHKHMFDAAIFAVCNLSDIPENQVYLSQKKEVVDQVLSVIEFHQPFMYCSTAVGILGNLVQAKEAHQYIFKEDLVNRVMAISHSSVGDLNSDKMKEILLKYYIGIMLSQMILGSANLLKHFKLATLLKMKKLLADVLKIHPMDIGRYEKDNGMTWGSFLPLVFLYEPELHLCDFDSNFSEVCCLHQHATDLILYSLQSTLWQKEYVKVLIEDQLLDYVVMLPWYVPAQSRDRSAAVVNELARVRQLDPPSLSIMCRGKLSKVAFGLHKFLQIKSVSQLTELFNT